MYARSVVQATYIVALSEKLIKNQKYCKYSLQCNKQA